MLAGRLLEAHPSSHDAVRQLLTACGGDVAVEPVAELPDDLTVGPVRRAQLWSRRVAHHAQPHRTAGDLDRLR